MPKSKHTELWLVRCPGDFDPALLNGLALDLTRESTPVGDLCVREAAAAEAAELVVAAPGEKRWRIGRPFARQLVVGVPPARGGVAPAPAPARARPTSTRTSSPRAAAAAAAARALRLRHSVEGVRGAPRAAAAAEESAAAEARRPRRRRRRQRPRTAAARLARSARRPAARAGGEGVERKKT